MTVGAEYLVVTVIPSPSSKKCADATMRMGSVSDLFGDITIVDNQEA